VAIRHTTPYACGMVNGITHRLARVSDAAPIARMARDLIECGLGWSWRPERVAAQVRCPDTVALMAETPGGRVLGFAIMHFGYEIAHLNLIAVAPSSQRSGVGQGLIEWLEKSARVAGVGSVRLEVRAGNQGARRFYRSLDYREIGLVPGYYDGREAAVRMVHHLRRNRRASNAMR